MSHRVFLLLALWAAPTGCTAAAPAGTPAPAPDDPASAAKVFEERILPIFKSSDLTAQLKREFGIHEKTTPGLLRQMRVAGILRELKAGSGRRPATLCFPRLINLAEGRELL